MPRDGALTLSDVRQPTLSIVCEPCGRRGAYKVARLMELHGDAKLQRGGYDAFADRSANSRCLRIPDGWNSPLLLIAMMDTLSLSWRSPMRESEPEKMLIGIPLPDLMMDQFMDLEDSWSTREERV